MTPETMSGAGFAEAFKRFDNPDGRIVNVGPGHFITACRTWEMASPRCPRGVRASGL